MENFTRNFSRNLSRSVSSSVDANRVWRTSTYGGFEGGRSMRTVRLGEENNAKFSIIKKMFNFRSSKKDEKKVPKAGRSSKIASSDEEFQSRLLAEIYKNMSSNHELSSV